MRVEAKRSGQGVARPSDAVRVEAKRSVRCCARQSAAARVEAKRSVPTWAGRVVSHTAAPRPNEKKGRRIVGMVPASGGRGMGLVPREITNDTRK